MIASVAGSLDGGRLLRTRPFRAPHHSASMPALVGGGLRIRPGEVSLAHLGVLFLDELPEFQRSVLDSLRQPLETGEISVARANSHVTFPANVQLVAAMNPCRCGHLGDAALACSRAPRCAADYQAKISGPLLDRIDLHVDVQAVRAADLALPPLQKVLPRSQRGFMPRAFCKAHDCKALACGPMRIWMEMHLRLSPRQTLRVRVYSPKLRRPCAYRRGAIHAYCGLPAPSPIWQAPLTLAVSILRRR